MSGSFTQASTSLFGPRGLTWTSGVSPTVRYAEGLSAHNAHGDQDEEAE